MKVKLASNCGFCFGVKRAIKIAEDYKNSSTMGPLIHNQDEINRLKNDFNVGLYNNLSDVKDNDTVIIRTHGIPKNELKDLRKLNAKVINATCPFVTALYSFSKVVLINLSLSSSLLKANFSLILISIFL